MQNLYKINQIQNAVDNSRLPKQALLYKPRGRTDGQLMSEQETLLYLEVMMMITKCMFNS
jgi:hypothetical protein